MTFISSCNTSEHSVEIGGKEVAKTLGLSLPNVSCYLKYIYDPLGLLSACTVLAKITLQQLWLIKLSWDELVPDNVLMNWCKIRYNLSSLNSYASAAMLFVKILPSPRCMVSVMPVNQLMVVVYTKNQQLDAFINLLCAKTKVAPIKSLTIPKLELCGALILAKLARKVIDSARIKFDCCTFWTDSTIVLGWLRTSPHLLKVFVGNRVAEILSLTGNHQWRHVDSKQTPADLLPQGVFPDQLVNCKIWWEGPAFLTQDTSQWPLFTVSSANLLEFRPKKAPCLLITEKLDFPFEKFSSLSKLKRVISWIYRSLKIVVNRRKREILNCYLSKKLIFILHYASELKALLSGDSISKSNILNLSQFVDKDGILRVGDRLRNSPYVFDKKTPYSTPSQMSLVTADISQQTHPDVTSIPENRLSQYQKIQAAKQRFWQRWHKEYINQLQVKSKWLQNPNQDHVPPSLWRLFRVIAIHSGVDGQARVATLKTSHGEVRRAFSKLQNLLLKKLEQKYNGRSSEHEIALAHNESLKRTLKEKEEEFENLDISYMEEHHKTADKISFLNTEVSDRECYIRKLEKRLKDFEDEVTETEKRYVDDYNQQKSMIKKLYNKIEKLTAINQQLECKINNHIKEIQQQKKCNEDLMEINRSMVTSIRLLENENNSAALASASAALELEMQTTRETPDGEYTGKKTKQTDSQPCLITSGSSLRLQVGIYRCISRTTVSASMKGDVKLIYVPSHTGITGNEHGDKLALAGRNQNVVYQNNLVPSRSFLGLIKDKLWNQWISDYKNGYQNKHKTHPFKDTMIQQQGYNLADDNKDEDKSVLHPYTPPQNWKDDSNCVCGEYGSLGHIIFNCVARPQLCNRCYSQTLELLPDSVDPMELLSYLDPPDLNTPPSSGSSSGHNNTSTNDDILALFE
nr:unnamed protein product [Callosobruchus analis]